MQGLTWMLVRVMMAMECPLPERYRPSSNTSLTCKPVRSNPRAWFVNLAHAQPDFCGHDTLHVHRHRLHGADVHLARHHAVAAELSLRELRSDQRHPGARRDVTDSFALGRGAPARRLPRRQVTRLRRERPIRASFGAMATKAQSATPGPIADTLQKSVAARISADRPATESATCDGCSQSSAPTRRPDPEAQARTPGCR